MAKLKQTDQGERQTIKVLVWLTPTERAKLDKRIADEERQWVASVEAAGLEITK